MILIKGGRVIDPKSGTDAVLDIKIEKGIIAGIGTFAEDDAYEEIIHAEGKCVAPGLIDVHAHFRDPGLTYKEDIVTGANAAAAGGYTTVICMANTKPTVDNEETLTDLRERAKTLPVHVLNTATVTKGLGGKELTDMRKLRELGAVGFTDDGIPIMDVKLVLEAMRLVKELDVPISFHEEDPALLASPGVNQGRVSALVGVGGAPAVAESTLVARDCLLAKETGARIDIQHISSADSVEIVRTMKKMGVHVYAEVTPQHFSATEELVLERGSLARVNPPLRTEQDRQALIEGLKDGTLDLIATDHAPHSREEKERPIASAPSGMIGLETALALAVTKLVREGHLSMLQMIEKLTINPAKLYGLDIGYLAEGKDADLVIFDEKEKWIVPDTFASKSNNSPFIGWEVYGKVKYTICGGKIVYRG